MSKKGSLVACRVGIHPTIKAVSEKLGIGYREVNAIAYEIERNKGELDSFTEEELIKLLEVRIPAFQHMKLSKEQEILIHKYHGMYEYIQQNPSKFNDIEKKEDAYALLYNIKKVFPGKVQVVQQLNEKYKIHMPEPINEYNKEFITHSYSYYKAGSVMQSMRDKINNKNAKDVIESLISVFPENRTKYKKLLEALHKDTKIKIVKFNEDLAKEVKDPKVLEGNKAFYSLQTNNIYINEDSFLNSPETVLRTLEHELVHAATSIYLDANPEVKQQFGQYVKYARTEYYKNKGGEQEHLKTDENGQQFYDVYGFTDIHEFLAEFISNSEFRTILKNIPAVQNKEKSLFSIILDKITRIINVILGNPVSTSVYDQAEDIFNFVSKSQKEQLSKDKEAVEKALEFALSSSIQSKPLKSDISSDSKVAESVALINQVITKLKDEVKLGMKNNNHWRTIGIENTDKNKELLEEIKRRKLGTEIANKEASKVPLSMKDESDKNDLQLFNSDYIKVGPQDLAVPIIRENELRAGLKGVTTIHSIKPYSPNNTIKTVLGSNVDAVLRYYFRKHKGGQNEGKYAVETGTALADFAKNTIFTEDQLKELEEQFQALDKYFSNTYGENYQIFTTEIALAAAAEVNGHTRLLQGIPDILLIDSDGKIHIIDLKVTDNVQGVINSPYGNYYEQVETYKNMLKATLVSLGHTDKLDELISDKCEILNFNSGLAALNKYLIADDSNLEEEIKNASPSNPKIHVTFTSTTPQSGENVLIPTFNVYTGNNEPKKYTYKDFIDNTNNRSLPKITLPQLHNSAFAEAQGTTNFTDPIIDLKQVEGNTNDIKNVRTINQDALDSMYNEFMGATDNSSKQGAILPTACNDSTSEQSQLRAGKKSSKEIYFLGGSIAINISNILDTFFYSNKDYLNTYAKNIKFKRGRNFKNTNREDILQAIEGGIDAVLKDARETYNPNNLYDENGQLYDWVSKDLLENITYIYNRFYALVPYGNYKLMDLEHVTVENNSTDIVLSGIDDSLEDMSESIEVSQKDAPLFQTNLRNVSVKNSLSKTVRRVLSSLQKLQWNSDTKSLEPVYDEFGYEFETYIDEDAAVDTLLNICNKYTTWEEMYKALERNAPTMPWIYNLIGHKESGIEGIFTDNPQLQSQFFQALRKDKNIYSIDILVQDEETGVFKYVPYIINSNDAESTLLDFAMFNIEEGNTSIINIQKNGNHKVNMEAIEGLKATFSTIQDINASEKERIKLSQNLLKALGFPEFIVTEDVVKRLIVNSNTGIQRLVSYSNLLFKRLESCSAESNITNVLDIPSNINSGNVKYDITPLLKKIATEVLAEHVEAIGESSVFQDNKMYYSYTTPSYIAKEVKILNNSAGENFQEGLGDTKFEKHIKANYSSDDFLCSDTDKDNINIQEHTFTSYWLQELVTNKSARDIFKHKVVVSIDKTGYKDWQKYSYAASMFAQYFNSTQTSEDIHTAWYRVPIMANKPTAEYIQFFKYIEEDENSDEYYQKVITDKLVPLFKAELFRIQTVIERYAENKSKIEFYDIDPKDIEGLTIDKDWRKTLKNKDFEKLLKSGASFKFFRELNDYLINGTEDSFGDLMLKYIKDDKNAKDSKNNPITLSSISDEFRKIFINDIMPKKVERELAYFRSIGIFNSRETTVNGDTKTVYPAIEAFTPSGSYEAYKSKEGDAGHESFMNDVTDKLTNFIWNDMFATINIIQITTGDLAYYKNIEEFQKRFAQVHSPGLKFNKAAQIKTLSGEFINVSDGMERSMKLKDVFKPSSTITEKFIKIVFNRLFNDLKDKSDKNLLNNVEIKQREALLTEIQNKAIKGFSEIDVANAQGLTSPTAMRKKLAMAGRWTEAMEEAYSNILKGDLNEANLSLLLQPLKPFAYGLTHKQIGTSRSYMQQINAPIQQKNSEYMIFLADAVLKGVLSSQSDEVESEDFQDLKKLMAQSRAIALFDFMENTAYDGRIIIRNGKIYKDGKQIKADEARKSEDISNEDKALLVESKLPNILYKVLSVGTYNGKGIDTIQFESAIKVGKIGAIQLDERNASGKITRDFNYDETINTLTSLAYTKTQNDYLQENYGIKDNYNTEYVDIIDFDNYSLQQEVPDHFADHKQLYGSQIRILGVTDMECEELTYAGKTLKRQEFIQHYLDLQASLIKKSLEELEIELNLTADGRKAEIKRRLEGINKINLDKDETLERSLDVVFADLEHNKLLNPSVVREDRNFIATIKSTILNTDKALREDPKQLFDLIKDKDFTPTKISKRVALSALLKQEISSNQKYGTDLIYACSLTEGEWNLPLGDPCQSIRIQQLINSIIKSRINKQKMSGGPVVQVSCYGLADDLKAVTKPDGSLDYIECYMPIPTKEMQQTLTNALTGKIMSPKEALEKGAINEDQLKAIGYRIPTEDKYSMLPLRVVGFMPHGAGEGIIVSKEITQFTGSDFDIDKMYVMIKNFKAINKEDFLDAVEDKVLNTNNPSKLRDLGLELSSSDKSARVVFDRKSKSTIRIMTMNLQKQSLESLVKKYPRSAEAYRVIAKAMNKVARVTFVESTNERDKTLNELFDMEMAVLTHPDTMIKQLNYQSFESVRKPARVTHILEVLNTDTEKRDELIKEISHNYKNIIGGETTKVTMQLYELSKNDKGLKYLNSLNSRLSEGADITMVSTQLKFHNQNMVAAKLIGAFANNNVSHGVIQIHNDLHPEKLIEINFNDNGLIKNSFILDPIRDDNGNLISRNLAEFLGASVDAVKDSLMPDININATTVNATMVLTRMGFPNDFTAFFMSQPIIKKLVETQELNSVDGYHKLESTISEILNNEESFNEGISVSDYYKKLNDDSGNPKDITSEFASTFTIENMLDQIYKGERKNEMAMKTLVLFRQLAIKATQLNDLTFVTKYNSVSNAQGPTISHSFVMASKANDFTNSMNDDTPAFNNADLLFDDNLGNPMLKAFKEGSEKAAELLFEDDFIHYSPKFQEVLNTLKYSVQYDLDADLINKLVAEWQLFTMTYEDNQVINPDKLNYYAIDFIKEYMYSKGSKRHLIPDIMKTDFFKALSVTKASNKCPIPFLKLNITSMSETKKEEYMNTWEEWLNSDNENIQKFALHLVYYNIFRSGLLFNPKTFTHLLSTKAKHAIPRYIEATRNIEYQNANMTNDKIYLFIKQFMLNNSSNYKLVPYFKPNKNLDVSINRNDKSLTISNKDESNGLFVLETKKQFSEGPSYAPIIKYKNVLYMYNAEDSNIEAGILKYDRVKELGIKNSLLVYDANVTDIKDIKDLNSKTSITTPINNDSNKSSSGGATSSAEGLSAESPNNDEAGVTPNKKQEVQNIVNKLTNSKDGNKNPNQENSIFDKILDMPAFKAFSAQQEISKKEAKGRNNWCI